MAELVAHVNQEAARKQSKDDGADVEHVFTYLEGVHRKEAVSGIVAVDKVIREEPELEAKVIEDTPDDHSKNSSGNKEHEQVETDIPDALLEPERPQSEAHEHEDDQNN